MNQNTEQFHKWI